MSNVLPFVALHLLPEDLLYLCGDDTRLPHPSDSCPLLPGDPRLPLINEGCDFFSSSHPTLELKIRGAILSLGGSVFPKVCGVAPLDAGWASTPGGGEENMRCRSAGDVWTLLMASERVRDSLKSNAISESAAPCLILWRWQTLRHDCEVRCTLRDGKLAKSSLRYGNGPLQRFQEEAVGFFLASKDWVALLGVGDLTLDLYVGNGVGVSKLGDSGHLNETYILDIRPPGKDGEDEGSLSHEGIHFHPRAAHAFPEELFHYAAERVASSFGLQKGDIEGGEVGGVISSLAKVHAQEGIQGGWTRFVDDLHAQGAFVKGGLEDEREE